MQTYDPEIGTKNGDGIAWVEMSVVDPATGAVVYDVTRDTVSNTVPNTVPDDAAGDTADDTAGDAAGVVYCAFSETCLPWVFSEHNYTWPSGVQVHNGPYLLRATVSTPDNTRLATQTQIDVSVPPTFDTVYVPAGDFSMGSDSDNKNENPIHTVTLPDYWMMKTEVTNAQYAQCVRAGRVHDRTMAKNGTIQPMPTIP